LREQENCSLSNFDIATKRPMIGEARHEQKCGHDENGAVVVIGADSLNKMYSFQNEFYMVRTRHKEAEGRCMIPLLCEHLQEAAWLTWPTGRCIRS
jgi:hypothetical protein